MSSNWGDFNGDGKTNYTDYKIYTTQVDPYSGEYQGHSSRSSGGSGILLYILFILGIIILCLHSEIAIYIGLAIVVLPLCYKLGKAAEERNKRDAIRNARKRDAGVLLSRGGWRCACGCVNMSFETECAACKKTKQDCAIQN